MQRVSKDYFPPTAWRASRARPPLIYKYATTVRLGLRMVSYGTNREGSLQEISGEFFRNSTRRKNWVGGGLPTTTYHYAKQGHHPHSHHSNRRHNRALKGSSHTRNIGSLRPCTCPIRRWYPISEIWIPLPNATKAWLNPTWSETILPPCNRRTVFADTWRRNMLAFKRCGNIIEAPKNLTFWMHLNFFFCFILRTCTERIFSILARLNK